VVPGVDYSLDLKHLRGSPHSNVSDHSPVHLVVMLQVDRLLARPLRPLSLIWQSTLPGGHSGRAAATMHLILLNSKMNKVVVKNLDIPQSNKNIYYKFNNFVISSAITGPGNHIKWILVSCILNHTTFLHYRLPQTSWFSEVASGFIEKAIKMNCSRNNNNESKKKKENPVTNGAHSLETNGTHSPVYICK
jgi:hypothetical protein